MRVIHFASSSSSLRYSLFSVCALGFLPERQRETVEGATPEAMQSAVISIGIFSARTSILLRISFVMATYRHNAFTMSTLFNCVKCKIGA